MRADDSEARPGVERLRHIMHRDRIDLPSGAGGQEADDLTDFTIDVELRLRFQVVLDDPTTADRIRVLDGEGRMLELHIQTASSYHDPPVRPPAARARRGTRSTQGFRRAI